MIDLGAAAASDTAVVDSTDQSFMADVIDASKEVPVIVDFWAPWCGPCKTLGPVLEEAVRATKGLVKMVKVNVDENQMVAGQLRVQSIPAVFAFHNGQPVDGFMGAITSGEVKEFVTRMAKLGGGADDGLEEALEAAEAMLEQGALADASQTFAAILGEDPANARALGGLARAYIAAGDIDQARALLDSAPAETASDPAIQAARAALDLAEQTADTGEVSELRARLDANADDHQARYDLSLALLGQNDRDGAVEELLELFRRDREWNDSAARHQLMKLFESFGPTDPLTLKGRRRLSSMIFA